jgi:hypothetical protein
MSLYAGAADVYTCDELSGEERYRILEYVRRKMGYEYDYLLITWEAIRYFLHRTLPFREPPHTCICSTLWCEAYRSVGVDLCPEVPFPSPADLARSLRLRKVSEI